VTGEGIRVAFYTDSETLGGAEQALATLVGNLSDEFEVTVVAVSPEILGAVAAAPSGAERRLLPPVRAPWDVRAIATHFSLLRELRPDVFHAQGSSPWVCEYGLAAAVTTPGVRAISVVQSPSPSSRWRERALLKLTARRIAAYVAPGRRSARELEAVAGLERGSVTVVHNGVEDVRVTPAPRPTEAPLVGWIGRLAREKGVDVLLAALAELPGVTALLVGDGPERGTLEALVARLGIGERVIFAGWQAEPRAFLHALDVFCLPSRSEAFPLAILEAMLAEIPVVASDVGSVEEAVSENTGLLVQPEDPRALASAIRRLLESPDERRRLGEAGRALVLDRYTGAAMARAYEKLYKRVLAT